MVKIFLTLLMALVGGCQIGSAAQHEGSIVTGRDLSQFPELRKAMEQYYVAEKNRNWQIAYGYRPVAFQRTVPFDVYQREMEKGSSGWSLIRVEILESKRVENDEVKVMLKFYESFDAATAQSYYDGRVPSGINSRVEETIWKWSGNSWLSVQPGQRGHFPLNDRLAY